MKEQYCAIIQDGFCKEGEWMNANKYLDFKNSRYCTTLDEAKEMIAKAIKRGNNLSKRHNMGEPPFCLVCDEDERCIITNTKIKKRMVSEWEEV